MNHTDDCPLIRSERGAGDPSPTLWAAKRLRVCALTILTRCANLVAQMDGPEGRSRIVFGVRTVGGNETFHLKYDLDAGHVNALIG